MSHTPGTAGGASDTWYGWLAARQTSRPARRRTSSSSGTCDDEHAGDARPALGEHARRAPRPARGCAGSRRARSRAAASGCEMRSRDHADRRPRRARARRASMIALAPRGRASRARGDVRAEHVAGRDVRHAAGRGDGFAWVPFPAPGGPNRARPASPTYSEEALVVAHHHLRLHLPHRVERDADHDQDRGAAERRGAVACEKPP